MGDTAAARTTPNGVAWRHDLLPGPGPRSNLRKQYAGRCLCALHQGENQCPGAFRTAHRSHPGRLRLRPASAPAPTEARLWRIRADPPAFFPNRRPRVYDGYRLTAISRPEGHTRRPRQKATLAGSIGPAACQPTTPPAVWRMRMSLTGWQINQ